MGAGERRCAVLGDPVAHSLSPVLHRAAYAGLGLDWTYERVRVPAGGLAECLGSLDDSWRGLSLTMPLKREVVALLDSSDRWTATAGAANTVLLDERGRHGLNTDVPGVVAALRSATDRPLTRAVVVGGGATAASVLLALAELGTHHVTLVVRDPARASDTLAAVARHPRPPVVEVTRPEGPLIEAEVVVSTVPAPAQTDALLERVAGVPVVFEVVYDPWPTPLMTAATTSGRTLVTGLDLLLWQAVDQVRAMTGRFDVPVDAMRAALADAVALG